MTQAQGTRSKSSTSVTAAKPKAAQEPATQGTKAGNAPVPVRPLVKKSAAPERVKPAPKALQKPIAAAAASAPEEASTHKSGKKAAKLRPVLVRDSFTMPESDFALLAALKAKALSAGRAAKKSELLRAGLRQLMQLEAQPLAQALDELEAVKTGRPKKGH